LVIHDVLYVEGLKHNLLSISQLCDKGYQVMFKENTCDICLPNTKEIMLVGNVRKDGFKLEGGELFKKGFRNFF